ncbi:MAG: 4-hydroxythreonine-4-phosphate dehydrogenase PdxA [Pseudomonadota bacterium]
MLPLAVTMGEPAGIGPEIIAKAWRRGHELGLPPFFMLGAPEAIRAIDRHVPVIEIAAPEAAGTVYADALPVLPLPLSHEVTPGRPQPAAAQAVIAAIRHAVALVQEARAAALVTAPIAKGVLYQAGFTHPGQSEFLAELCHVPVADIAMLLASPRLRVAPLTIHVPLAQVAKQITEDLIVRRGRVLAAALKRDFRIPEPRIAVCALNPHAGEGGALGREEIDVIAPAMARLRGEGLAVSGPHAADSLFHEDARAHYDAALAMYHDQALIPLKTLDFHDGVNITLGLPIVRTSPDHGAAFAIAGKGMADPRSMIAAIGAAAKLARNRHG